MLNPIEEIKSRLDIVEVIGSYIKLQKAGVNYRALCPFHSEKKPSFFVSSVRQIWHCFGCSVGGDIFKFIMKIEGVEFGDALRILAKRAGVELKPMRPESASWRTERQRLYEICELACRFFEKQLESKIGQEAKNYLIKRGINEESIKQWRIGYSPDTWQGLSDFLVSKGYNREEVIKAGLAVESEKTENPYDRFRGRIIFPIFDLNSQVIGFGGRVFKETEKEDIAKYINTPNTLLYDKSRVLYGLNFAKMEIRKKDSCILVEGYTDTILNHQVGYKNTIAVSGTALTPYQLKILKRYSANLLICFDMDVAGDFATQRGIDLAQKEDFEIKVIILPKEKDPAELIFENKKLWEESVEKAKSILEFYFETTFSKFDSKRPEGKKEISKILLPIIKRIPNKILQSHWLNELAKRFKVPEEIVVEEFNRISIKEQNVSEIEENKSEIIEKSRKELIEEKILSLILKTKKNLEMIDKEILSFFSSKVKEILLYLKKGKEVKELEKMENPDWKDTLNFALLRAEIDQDSDDEIKICLNELIVLQRRNELEEISKAISRAEEEGDQKKIKKLMEEFNQKAKKLIG